MIALDYKAEKLNADRIFNLHVQNSQLTEKNFSQLAVCHAFRKDALCLYFGLFFINAI